MPAITRIEGRLAHQPVHAGLGAQPAVGVIAGHADRHALDAGHFAVALVDDLGLDAVAIGPFQVHAQQHRRPVLGFGPARARLNVEKGAVRVHLAGKHPLEFQALHDCREIRHVGLDFRRRGAVRFPGDHVEQFTGIAQAERQPVEALDHLFEFGALTTQILGAVRVVPDARLFQLARYFLETFVLVVVIKDTSSRNRCVPRDL